MLELVPDTLTLCPAYGDTAAEGSSPAFCRTVCSSGAKGETLQWFEISRTLCSFEMTER